MAILRSVAPRIFLDTDPYVERIPVYSPEVFYPTGAIVSQPYQLSDSDSDSVYYSFYAASKDISPNAGDPSTNNDWTIYTSGDPRLPTVFSDSEVFAYVDNLDSDYKVAFSAVDSDMQYLSREIKDILDFDSDIIEIQRDIIEIQEKNIIDSLTDSEASNNKAIAWDAVNNKFKFVSPVISVNSELPNSAGNVSVQFTKASSGSRDERPDSETSGSIFVVINDSDSEVNGITYSFTNNGWVRVIGYTELENDLLYVNNAGDTMTGPLLLSRDPVSDSEAATKRYVDGFNDSDKQDRIITVADIPALNAYPTENNRIYHVKSDNTLWIKVDGVLKDFKIPAQRIFDSAMTEAFVSNLTSTTFFDATVNTYRFSDFLPGTLRVQKTLPNGLTSNVNLIFTNNISGTFQSGITYSDVKLTNAAVQAFSIKCLEQYNINNKYFIEFTAHDGKTTTIELGGQGNVVTFDEVNRTLNFGEY